MMTEDDVVAVVACLTESGRGCSYRYPPEGFLAEGNVAGHTLPCLTAEVQIECHTGYEPTETDRHDVALLAERFGLPLPRGYS